MLERIKIIKLFESFKKKEETKRSKMTDLKIFFFNEINVL